MKTKVLLLALYGLAVVVFNGCTMFSGDDCSGIPEFEPWTGDTPLLQSWSVSGEDDTPPGMSPEGARTLEVDGDVVTMKYTLPDGREVAETWQITGTQRGRPGYSGWRITADM